MILWTVNEEEVFSFFTPEDVPTFPFTELSDTPDSYSGQGLKLVQVKLDESGLEFVPSTAGFSGSYNDLTDLPVLFSGVYADLTGKPTLFTQAAADALYSVLAHTHLCVTDQ